MRDLVEMRRKMAQRLASFSEGYRTDVWKDLQARFEELDTDTDTSKGWFGFLRRNKDRKAPPEAHNADTTAARMDDLLSAVNARAHLARRSSDIAEQHRDDVWQRVRENVTSKEMVAERRSSSGATRRWVLAAAAAALVVAALGPIPATGLAHHPAVDAARLAGEELGVVETKAHPPTPIAVDVVVTPSDITAAEAADALGFVVRTPESIPGFTLKSSRLFSAPITADNGGTFMLTYDGGEAGTLAVYQEAVGGGSIAVNPGSAVAVTLADGTVGSYVYGGWDMASISPAWSDADMQTVVFDRAGVRTIVQYTGDALGQADLISIAGLI